MTGFAPDSANRALRAISRLRAGRTPAGVVLDLRGNGGGSPVEAARLLSAFVHGRVTAYQCTADDRCETARTDDTVALLGLPLVVLTDHGCASACEHFGCHGQGPARRPAGRHQDRRGDLRAGRGSSCSATTPS